MSKIAMSNSICTIKMLPQEQLVAAATRAIEINPVNAPAMDALRAAAPGVIIPPEHLALLTAKYWGSTGVHLTVGFLDNPPADLRARILLHMNAWAAWANVQFVETATNPQVRIARANSPADKAGYWSYVGTDILHIPADQPTMNLDSFTMNMRDSEFYRVVRHETGHTLGFPHEHKREEIVNRIDRAKAIQFFMATQGWSEAKVIEQVLTPLNNSALSATAHADVNSIMCYWLPASIMRDNTAVDGGPDIDAQDGQFAGTVYPQTPRLIGAVSARHSGKVLDVAGGSADNGARIIQWDYHGGGNQLFRLEPLGDGSYRLVAQHSGRVLDVEGGSADNGARIIQWDWHGGPNQRFNIQAIGLGYYRMSAQHSGRVLDVSGGSTDSGAQIIQWDWHGGPNQQWKLARYAFARHSGKVLDVAGGSADSGAPIIQWDFHGGGNQLFRPEHVGGGFYRLVAEQSGKVLDVEGGSADSGARIIQWDWLGGANQRFRLNHLGNGFYRVTAQHSGKVLDVSRGSTASGAQIIQWDWLGGANQQWRF